MYQIHPFAVTIDSKTPEPEQNMLLSRNLPYP